MCKYHHIPHEILVQWQSLKLHAATYLSDPKISLALSLLNSANPVIGRYSLTRDLKTIQYKALNKQLFKLERKTNKSRRVCKLSSRWMVRAIHCTREPALSFQQKKKLMNTVADMLIYHVRIEKDTYLFSW